MTDKQSAAEGLSDEQTDAGRLESLHDMVAQGSVLMKVETDLYGDPSRYRIGVQWLGDDDHREYVASDFRVALDSAINGDPPIADDEKRLVIWDWDEPPKEEIEAIIACLGDDAAQLREANDEDERAANMDEAASMLARLERANRQLFELGQRMHTQLEAVRAATHPASPQGQAGAIPPAVLTEEEREHIHQAIDMLGRYEAEQRDRGNNTEELGASATRYVLEKLFRFLPGRLPAADAVPAASEPASGAVQVLREAASDALQLLERIVEGKEWGAVEEYMDALRAALSAAPGADGGEGYCIWQEEDPDGYMPGTYASACGELWAFTEGGPTENNVRFCQGCGKPIEVVSFPTPADEDAADGVAGAVNQQENDHG